MVSANWTLKVLFPVGGLSEVVLLFENGFINQTLIESQLCIVLIILPYEGKFVEFWVL